MHKVTCLVAVDPKVPFPGPPGGKAYLDQCRGFMGHGECRCAEWSAAEWQDLLTTYDIGPDLLFCSHCGGELWTGPYDVAQDVMRTAGVPFKRGLYLTLCGAV